MSNVTELASGMLAEISLPEGVKIEVSERFA
jgi:hypothetical protein